jgi:hypothetical protein
MTINSVFERRSTSSGCSRRSIFSAGPKPNRAGPIPDRGGGEVLRGDASRRCLRGGQPKPEPSHPCRAWWISVCGVIPDLRLMAFVWPARSWYIRPGFGKPPATRAPT